MLTATVAVTGAGADPLGGTVTFGFQSYAMGSPDLSWPLGAVAVAGGTLTGGTATLSTPIPPGLVAANGTETVDVVAMYGGDADHLASTSAKLTITITGVTFAIVPETVTLAIKAKQTFTSTGGVAPVQWFTNYPDTTCDSMGNCSDIDQTTGVFTAGPMNGTVTVVGLDADGAEAYAYVTVGTGNTSSSSSSSSASSASSASSTGTTTASSSASTTASSTSGTGGAGGTTGSGGAGTGGTSSATASSSSTAGAGGSPAPPQDGGSDGGEAGATVIKTGCACGVAESDDAPAGMLGAVALGLVAMKRRRRSLRDR
jgi:MYXO-CTERM domain-containing protein